MKEVTRLVHFQRRLCTLAGTLETDSTIAGRIRFYTKLSSLNIVSHL